MASPTEFTLNADVFRLVADTADVGPDMDMPAITGLELYFDPDLDDPDGLIAADISPRPVLIKPERVTGYVRSNGRMYDQPSVSDPPDDITDPGNLGVRLLASGSELNLDDILTYQVSSNTIPISGVQWGIVPWHIPAPTTDVTVDLASFAPVSSSSGEMILRGPPGAGVDAVRLSGGNIIFSYLGVDLPVPLAFAPASVPDGSVTTIKVVDANITLPKLSSGVQTSLGKADSAAQYPLTANSVGNSQIAADSVGSSELADNAVDTAAIIDANVTLPKLSAGVQTSLGRADTAAQIAGDLGGTAATPVVTKINGVAVTGTPTAGQVPTATGAAAAAWTTPTVGGTVAADTHAASIKTTPVDTDELPLIDSVASFGLKRLTWANLKAVLKTYFDTLTTTLTNKTIDLASNTVTMTRAQLNTAVSDADITTLTGAETLTTKTIALGSNTVSGTLAQFNTAITDADIAALAGDLGGSSAAPTVVKVNGITISGTPVAGYVPTATSPTVATWQAPTGGGSGVSAIDNGDGTGSLTGGTVVDNGDGTGTA